MSAGVFAIHAKPGRHTTLILSWFLFVAGVGLYFYTAGARHRENPEDRVTPTIAQMFTGMRDAVLRPAEDDEPLPEGASWSETIRHSMLWKDTRATGLRFIYSMALLFPAVLIGLHMGLFPYFGAFLLRFVLFFDKIIALSLLPILFIAFGIDELSKIMLIVIGVTPTVLLDTFNLTRGVPGEQVVKAFTLG
ncbi:MAG: ABC transporter permease, partial [Acidobacteriota bacterium]|nr:ABC transporter permease [Acidobacteriota bacterium]